MEWFIFTCVSRVEEPTNHTHWIARFASNSSNCNGRTISDQGGACDICRVFFFFTCVSLTLHSPLPPFLFFHQSFYLSFFRMRSPPEKTRSLGLLSFDIRRASPRSCYICEILFAPFLQTAARNPFIRIMQKDDGETILQNNSYIRIVSLTTWHVDVTMWHSCMFYSTTQNIFSQIHNKIVGRWENTIIDCGERSVVKSMFFIYRKYIFSLVIIATTNYFKSLSYR